MKFVTSCMIIVYFKPFLCGEDFRVEYHHHMRSATPCVMMCLSLSFFNAYVFFVSRLANITYIPNQLLNISGCHKTLSQFTLVSACNFGKRCVNGWVKVQANPNPDAITLSWQSEMEYLETKTLARHRLSYLAERLEECTK